jgi:hypothetical protein
MPGEEVREQINEALEQAIAGDADLTEIKAALKDGLDRIEEIRVLRGESGGGRE